MCALQDDISESLNVIFAVDVWWCPIQIDALPYASLCGVRASGDVERKEREYLLARRWGEDKVDGLGAWGRYVGQYLRARRSIAGTARD